MTKVTWGGKGLYLTYTSTVKTGTQVGQEAEKEVETTRGPYYWPAPPGILSMLSYTLENFLPRVGTAHTSYQSAMEKMPPQTFPQQPD